MSQLIRKHSFNEVFDSQGVFRKVLEALSNPSRVVNIRTYADKLFGDYPGMLALAITLLDNEVSFNACENDELTDEIVSLTLSRREKLSEADFIFVCNPDDLPDAMASIKSGTLANPHKSATVIIHNDDQDIGEMILVGPGIKGKQRVFASMLIKHAMLLRNQQSFEYPQGIDLFFLSTDGELIGIPRLVRWEVS